MKSKTDVKPGVVAAEIVAERQTWRQRFFDLPVIVLLWLMKRRRWL